ncbi:MAG: hypothetical protein FWF95_02390 [Syntrophorhabdaceae bacterium]|nr:hypothetical protein [Syntrophorhabdaceae bacterium]
MTREGAIVMPEAEIKTAAETIVVLGGYGTEADRAGKRGKNEYEIRTVGSITGLSLVN